MILGQILKASLRPAFAGELHDLIDRWRDQPGVIMAELVDAMEIEVEALVEEVNERAA
jgi:hypothetical protein